MKMLSALGGMEHMINGLSLQHYRRARRCMSAASFWRSQGQHRLEIKAGCCTRSHMA
jgi:hypothetical protein